MAEAYLPIVLRTKKLRGAHQALEQSVAIHSLHTDWEYDRYSSIGFYLHDRRGDWMRLWRLSQLYDNEPTHYRALVAEKFVSDEIDYDPTLQPSAS